MMYACKIFAIFLINLPRIARFIHVLDTSVSCDQRYFHLTLRFDEPFNGLIYSEKSFQNCLYVNASVLSQQYYSIKVPLDGCETYTNDEGNLENAVVVRDKSLSLDKKYLLTCILMLTTVGTTAVSRKEVVNFGGITVNSPSLTTEVIKARGFGQVPQYKVELVRGNDGSAVDLSSPISVGDPISYVIRVPSLLTDARIGRCWARDAASSLELSDDDGCSLQLKGNVWNNFERSEYNGEVVFRNSIKAWAFPTSSEVNIFCNLYICRSSCHMTICTTRQRRHYQKTDTDKIETIATSLRIATVLDKREFG